MTDETKTDSVDRPPVTDRAAGVLFKTPDGRALFLKRGPGSDFPGYWCFPGGHLEGSETPEDAAKREAIEEIGSLPKGNLALLARSISTYQLPPRGVAANGAAQAVALPAEAAPGAIKTVDFSTFQLDVDEPFDVKTDGEHVGFAWSPCTAPPEPLHPGCAISLERLFADELGVARMMADGRLTSPQVYRNVTLWAIRITGTGVSYRMPVLKRDKDDKVVLDDDGKAIVLSEEEFPWRDPALYLNEEFLARCNGLPVIAGHPKGKTLDSKEFGRRMVGTVFLPFIRGDEVWGIAKVYDDETNAELASAQYSTSPAVVLSDPMNPSYKFRLEDGSALLVEGKPSLLDHIAICERGVWDKGGDPAGIINDTHKETEIMADEVKVDSVKEPTMADVLAAIGGVAKRVDDIGARVDAMEKDDSEESEEEKKKKVDAEEEEKKKADAEAEEKAKADAEEEEKKKADAAKKDADGCATQVAADAMKKADSAVAATGDVAKRIAELEKKIPAERNDDDHRTMSASQARADSVFELFGRQAPRFLSGETNRQYRNRLVRDFQEHSPSWKPVDLAVLNDSAFAVAEEQVYADAALAAKNATGVEDGGLRMVPGTTPSGHRKVEFFGRTSALINRFSGTRRYATRINPNPSKSEVV